MNNLCNPNDYNGPGQLGNLPTEIQPCDKQPAACRGADGDGVTTCGGDCDDNDPSVQSCSGGGGAKDCGGDCALCCLEVGAYCDPWCHCYTPVLVDTAGDGLRLTGGREGVNFDIDADPATPNRLAWTEADSDDAWLALDRDGNGRIDDGTELFGDRTPQPPSSDPDGFPAPAEYDRPAKGGDGDGALGSGDAVFASLRLWADANHNGLSEPGELHPLLAKGVAKIELGYQESKRRDRHGNVFRYRAKVYGIDGVHLGRWAYDVFLAPPR